MLASQFGGHHVHNHALVRKNASGTASARPDLPQSHSRALYRGQRGSRCPSAAAATEQATDAARLDKAVGFLAETLKDMKNLDPEHAQRTRPELQEPMAVLKALHEQSTIQLTNEVVDGYFNAGINTTDNLTDQGFTTLGTMTFQQFGPKKLKIQIQPGYWVGVGMEAPDNYQLYTIFKIAEGEHAGVRGYSLPNGAYTLDKQRPYRQHVHFLQTEIAPMDRSPEGLKAWKAALGDANPTMRDDGHIIHVFPKPVPAWRDFLFADDNLHITVGNRNSVVILRRAEQPPVPID